MDESPFKSLSKLGIALHILIILSSGEMQRDTQNQHSYITAISADRRGDLGDLVDVTVQSHSMAPFGFII